MTDPRIESILLGDSTPMRHLRSEIARFASSRLSVLIQGPTGSGKELVAQALHAASGRRGDFIPFNACAVTDTMFEDALFGHVKGAFSGATGDRAGYLAEANGGSVFLDEISGVTLAFQAKLLRAIETGSFRPVGASRDRTSDFRAISASNESLTGLVADGRFREDLLHRLSGVILRVPGLSARREDIAVIAHHFLALLLPSQAPVLRKDAIDALMDHSWPGNVRELKHVIERAAVLAGSGTITATHVQHSFDQGNERRAMESSQADLPERRELLRVLIETNWDTLAAAERLGVHRATVYRRIRQFGLDRSARGVDTPPGFSFIREGPVIREVI